MLGHGQQIERLCLVDRLQRDDRAALPNRAIEVSDFGEKAGEALVQVELVRPNQHGLAEGEGALARPAQFAQDLRLGEQSRVVGLGQRVEARQRRCSALEIASLAMDQGQEPVGAVGAAVAREDAQRCLELFFRFDVAAVAEEHDAEAQTRQQVAGVRPGERTHGCEISAPVRRISDLHEAGERGAKEALHVVFEIVVEVLESLAQHALEELFGRLSTAVSLEHPSDGVEAVAILDELEDERRLVIREDDLLGIVGPHEAVVQLAHLLELAVT